jgi:hypothetical protein
MLHDKMPVGLEEFGFPEEVQNVVFRLSRPCAVGKALESQDRIGAR